MKEQNEENMVTVLKVDNKNQAEERHRPNRGRISSARARKEEAWSKKSEMHRDHMALVREAESDNERYSRDRSINEAIK